MIEAWIYPKYGAASTVADQSVAWCSVVDYDDDSAAGSMASLFSYRDAISSSLTCGHYHRFVPRIAVGAYGGGVFTNYGNTQMWIDASSTGVKHYGVKVGCDVVGTAGSIQWIVRVHHQWRHCRST